MCVCERERERERERVKNFSPKLNKFSIAIFLLLDIGRRVGLRVGVGRRVGRRRRFAAAKKFEMTFSKHNLSLA